MLVLRRKQDERIDLEVEGMDDPIEITVISIDRNNVKIGIKANDSVIILRSELNDARYAV